MKKKPAYLLILIIVIIIVIGFFWINWQKPKTEIVENPVVSLIKEPTEQPKPIQKSQPKVEPKKVDVLEETKKQCQQNNKNSDVYFCLAKSGKWQDSDINILKLTNSTGFSVAHYLAQYNQNWLSNNVDILSIANNNGWTVAHSLAQFNPNFNPTVDILKMVDNNNLSVAHVLAQYNPTWSTNNKEILSLKNNAEESVAHFLVIANKLQDIKGEDIMNLTTIYGVSVKDLYKKRAR
ncbi:MAG: hypothetical protein LBH40_05565 [Alphaproteobacteria bacterium]|jgi:hypothetical protein|nr:hypothetical protein [Alphaproteobacteria bacterium]